MHRYLPLKGIVGSFARGLHSGTVSGVGKKPHLLSSLLSPQRLPTLLHHPTAGAHAINDTTEEEPTAGSVSGKLFVQNCFPNLEYASLDVVSRLHPFLSPSDSFDQRKSKRPFQCVLSIQRNMKKAASHFAALNGVDQAKLLEDCVFTRAILEQVFIKLYYTAESVNYHPLFAYDYVLLPESLQLSMEYDVRVFLSSSAYSFYLAFEHFFRGTHHYYNPTGVFAKILAMELFVLWWYANPDLLITDVDAPLRCIPNSPYCSEEETNRVGPSLNGILMKQLALNLRRRDTIKQSSSDGVLSADVVIPLDYRLELKERLSFLGNRRYHVRCALLPRVLQATAVCLYQFDGKLQRRCIGLIAQLYQFCRTVVEFDDNKEHTENSWSSFFSVVLATSVLFDYKKVVVSLRKGERATHHQQYTKYVALKRDLFMQTISVLSNSETQRDGGRIVFRSVLTSFEDSFYTTAANMESAPFKHLRDAFTLGKLWRTLFVRSCSLLPDVFHGSSIFSVLLATLTLENIAVAYPPNVTYGKEMSLTRFQYAVTQRQKEGEQQMELGKLYSKSILLSLFDTLATFSHDVFHAYCRLPSRLNGEIVSQAYEPSFFVLIRLILLNANVGENVNTVEDCLAYGVVEDLLPHCRTHTGTYLNKLLVQSLGRGGPSSAGLLFSEFSDALDHLSPTWAWAIVLETLLNSGLPVSVDMESLSAGGTVTQPLVEGPCTSFGVGSLSFKVLHQNRGALLQSAEETGSNELNTLVVLKHLSHLALALPDSSTRLCSLAAHADIRETHTIESSPVAILDEDEGEVTDLDPFGQEDEEGTNTDQVQEDVFTDFTHDFVHEDSGEVSAGVVGRLREGTGQSVSASAAPTSPAELYPQLKRDLSWYDPDAQRLFFSLLATLMWSVSPDAAFPNEESEVMTSSPGGVIQENEFVLLGCYYGSICRALEREITAVKRQSVLGQRLVLQHTLLTLCRTIPEYHLMASILLLKLRLAVYGTDSRGIFLTMAEEEALARVLYLNGVSVDGIVEWEKRVNLPEKLVANSAALLKSYLAERARLQDGRELTLLIGSILLYSMTLQVSTWKNGRTSSVMDFMSTTDVEYYLRYAHRHDYYTPQLLRGGRKGMDRQTADSGKGTLLSRIVFPSRQIGADSTGSNLSPLAANFSQTPSSVEDRVAGEVQKWALDEDETVMTLFRKYQ